MARDRQRAKQRRARRAQQQGAKPDPVEGATPDGAQDAASEPDVRKFAKSANRNYLEGYNATRGTFRGLGNTVAANAPVRFVDGEKTEDWIAANYAVLFGDVRIGLSRGRGPMT